jgi:MSHA pilin protein MshA
MKMLRNEKGFTLIELVLIIVILGILGAVATVQFGTIITDSKNSAIDGAFGSYNAQVALAINSLKALPTGGAGGTFDTDVFLKVQSSGSGIVISTFTGASNTFGICAGSTDCTDAAPPTCTGTHRGARVTYDPVTGGLTLGAKNDC